MQQMHLSAIFYTESAYNQSLPTGCEGLLAFCGFFPMRKHYRMTFSKKYPEMKFSTIAQKNKPAAEKCCNTFSDYFKYLFSNAFIDVEAILTELELIAPNSDTIIFEDFAEKTCCCESQPHPDVVTPPIAILDRVDSFMANFNLAHSVFRKAVSIPQRAGVVYKVFEGSQPDSYLTMKFQTKEGGKGGSRCIGINPYMLGFATGESVVDVADVSEKVGCKAWCCCILSLGCLYLPFIKQVKDSKSVVLTTNRRIVQINLMSPASDRVLDPSSMYSRVVKNFFEPCELIHFFLLHYFFFKLTRFCDVQIPPNSQNTSEHKLKAVLDAVLVSLILNFCSTLEEANYVSML